MTRLTHKVVGDVKDVILYTGKVILSDTLAKFFTVPKVRNFVLECLRRHKECDWGEGTPVDVAEKNDRLVMFALSDRKYQLFPDYVLVEVEEPVSSIYKVIDEVKKVSRKLHKSSWLFITTLVDKRTGQVGTTIMLDTDVW